MLVIVNTDINSSFQISILSQLNALKLLSYCLNSQNYIQLQKCHYQSTNSILLGIHKILDYVENNNIFLYIICGIELGYIQLKYLCHRDTPLLFYPRVSKVETIQG